MPLSPWATMSVEGAALGPHPGRLGGRRLLPGQVDQRQEAQLWGALLVRGWLLVTV